MPCARRSGDAAAQRGRICGRWEQMAFAPLKAKLSLLSGGKVMFSSLQGSNLSLVWCSWLPWGIKERVLLLLLISVGCPGSCWKQGVWGVGGVGCLSRMFYHSDILNEQE